MLRNIHRSIHAHFPQAPMVDDVCSHVGQITVVHPPDLVAHQTRIHCETVSQREDVLRAATLVTVDIFVAETVATHNVMAKS